MPAPIKIWDVWTYEDMKTADGTEDVKFVGREVSEGMVVRIDNLIVIDETTANKTMQIGFRRAEEDHILFRMPPRTNAYGIYLRRPFYLVAGEAPIGEVESASDEDVCHFFVRGIVVSGGSK